MGCHEGTKGLMKKTYTVPKPEWWKHLREHKKTFWKRQRRDDAKNIAKQIEEDT